MRVFVVGIALLLLLDSTITIEAFVPTSISRRTTATTTPTTTSNIRNNNNNNIRSLLTASTATQLKATKKKLKLPTVPNPYKKLPWNVQKDKEREERRLKQEAQRLHRQLGINEDASYEEITDATDLLISKAGDDKKQKIRIEVAKDRILQIRLNERLAGLARISQEVQAQSHYEKAGFKSDSKGVNEEAVEKKEVKEWNAPLWTQNLIIKPGRKQIMDNIKFWGGLNLLIMVVPSIVELMQYTCWMFISGKLTYNGVPDDLIQGYGVSRRGPKGPHTKIGVLLGITIYALVKVLVMWLLPDVARYRKYTPQLRFFLESIPLCISCIYLQPYKGSAPGTQ